MTIVRLFDEKKNDHMRSGIVWNMISSMLYSFQSAVLMLVVTRAGGLSQAGVFLIAYSVSQMFASIGSFSMRDFQVSDTKNKFAFDTYFSLRIITVIIMLLSCLCYSLGYGYRGEKILALMLLSLYRMIDCFDDLFHAEYQKKGRLDIAAKIFACRIFVASVVFCCVYYVSHSLVRAALSMLASAMIISFLCDHSFNKYYQIAGKFSLNGVRDLLISCLPICIGAFLYNYLVNSPKYAIDRILGEEMQAIFNIIYMPVFMIAMLSMFVFKPFIFSMGKAWSNNDMIRLSKMIIKQSFIICGLILIVLFCGSLLGIPVLSFIYGVDLTEYKKMFIMLLAFGGVVAFNSFGGAILTIIRKQRYILYAYLIALAVDLLLMDKMVEKYKLFGADLVYGIVMSTILVVYVTVIFSTLIKLKK